MRKIGVVGVQGGWSTERLADAVAEATGYRLVIEPAKVRLDLSAGKVICQDVDLSSLDALVIKKIGSRYSPDLLDRLEIFRFLAEKGVPVFSSPLSILRVIDRLTCTVTLRLADIPLPPTTLTEDVDVALQTVEEYGEAVFKPLFTSKARGMLLLSPGPDTRKVVEKYKQQNKILYIQKKVALAGYDLGVVFLGGKYLTTYARSKTGDAWNTTTVSGGKYIPYDPSPEIIELARKAQEPFGLDFTCVDVVETATGPFVFEVSAFGGFRGILEARGIDAAKLYIEYILNRLAQ